MKLASSTLNSSKGTTPESNIWRLSCKMCVLVISVCNTERYWCPGFCSNIAFICTHLLRAPDHCSNKCSIDRDASELSYTCTEDCLLWPCILNPKVMELMLLSSVNVIV